MKNSETTITYSRSSFCDICSFRGPQEKLSSSSILRGMGLVLLTGNVRMA